MHPGIVQDAVDCIRSLLDTLFETAQDAVFVMAGLDFVDCNPATLRMFGCDARSDIIGRTPVDFSPPTQPDGAASNEKAQRLVGAAFDGTPQQFEWQHRKLDGTDFDVEVRLNRFFVSGTAFVVAVVRDVTARKRAEAELLREKQLSERLVQQLPMPIAIIGEEDEIVLLNEEFTNVFGYTHEDVPDLATWRSSEYSEERWPASAPIWRDELDAASREGRAVQPRETTITAKDGTVHTVEVHVARSDRKVLVLVNDISERRRLELLRDRFLAAAAHELKTPVTTIKGYAQLLLRWAPAEGWPSRAQVAMTTIDAQCDRIQRRVDEMLAAARYRTGVAAVRAERIDLGELARDVSVRLQSTTDSHRMLLERPGPVLVEADSERLDEALATLLDRMLSAAPAGEDVRVRLWTEGTEARLSITGRGSVAPADQESAYFEPLFEARPGDARHLPTVELGPYLAKLAIERQKGRVWLERSEREDSVFVIALPRAEG